VAVRSQTKILGSVAQQEFGSTVANVGDLDLDGVTDVVAGAPGSTASDAIDRGAVHVLFMNRDGTVKAQQAISEAAGNFQGVLNCNISDWFGSSVASVGDLDGDQVQVCSRRFLSFLAVGSTSPHAASTWPKGYRCRS
jgi:FG-GAP repeat